MKDRKVRILVFVIIILSGGMLYLLSSYLWRVEALKSIGLELFAAGFTAILLEIVLQEKVLDEIMSELRAPAKILSSGRKLGRLYLRSFKQAKERIDIIAVSYTIGLDQHHKYFEHKLVHDKCQIRILIMDPTSPMYEPRARDEHGGAGDMLLAYINQMRLESDKTIKTVKAFYDEFTKRHGQHFRVPGSLRVRMYSGIPYFGYFRVDDHCIITPYFAFGYGIESPVLEIRDSSSALFEFYAKHFEVLWERADMTSIIDIREFSSLAQQARCA
ncbi:MAG: DUF5919 domain-containing protein [candidate division KSB1 bacterium]